MKVSLWVVAPTDLTYLKTGIALYCQKLTHYFSFQYQELPAFKSGNSLDVERIRQKEGEAILKKIRQSDYIVLLDERGKAYSSTEFSIFIQQCMLQSIKQLIFIIGGAYGFSEAVYARANQQLSLSKMTFSHQMVRLIFLEQLYRAASIMKNEPYHHGNAK
jgi:23S rRNA (pseudouridine1915-N3)-methyltransferase